MRRIRQWENPPGRDRQGEPQVERFTQGSGMGAVDTKSIGDK